MKKTFTLCLGLFIALAIKAQSDFPLQFADKDGNIIADGTTLYITDHETDDFGDVIMSSKLYVKNTSGETVHGGGAYNILEIGSGVFQTCFPANCVRQASSGSYTTANGEIATGMLKDMQTEWYPTAEGSCKVSYQLVTYFQNPANMKWMRDADGPTVTLIFNYGSTAVCSAAADCQVKHVEYYNNVGRQVSQSKDGILIVKTTYKDGSTAIRKQFKR